MKQQLGKTMSLELMKTYGKILDFDTNGFPADFDTDAILTVRDPDPDSFFHFSMIKVYVDASTGRHMVVIKLCPQSESNADEYKNDFEFDKSEQLFRGWQKIINESNQLLIKYGKVDTILEQSTDEFFNDFQIVNEDDDIHSYPTKVQLQIDKYLDDIVQRLEDYKLREDVSAYTVEELDVIIEEAKEIQDTQTRLTRKQVGQKIARLYALCKKVSLKVLGEVRSEFFKELVKGVMKNPQGAIDTITDALS